MGRHHIMDNIYAEGSLIFAKERPKVSLIIRRYVDRIYFCTNEHDPDERERAYYQRELLAPASQK